MANLGDGVGVTQRVQKVTIAKWAKKLSDLTKRKLVIFALLQKKGLITSGLSGGQWRWPVEIKEHTLDPFIDAAANAFQRVEVEENAFLRWRGYKVVDFATRQEKLENGGPEAMVKIFEGKSKKMQRNAMRRIAYEMYKDGNSTVASTANPIPGVTANRFHGIESFMDIGAQTASDELATVPSDSYANLSTVIGALNAEANYTKIWTPVIVSTNVNPGSGALSFSTNGDEFIRRMIINMSYGTADDENCSLVTLNKDSYEDLLNILDDKERLLVERGKGAELVSMGFNNVVEIDGVPVMWDNAVPTLDDNDDVVNGYGWNIDQMELGLLGPGDIFKSEVTFSSTFQGDEFFVWTLGNLRFESPKFFGKLAAIA
jgi:hypothetical protein